MAKKLLLAEDSLTIQKVFALTFHQSDISLTMVDNGEDAVRLAGEISPDLVVADVTLPDRNGFEVAAALRQGGATRSCPILILAGSLPPFDEETYRKSGADAVLFKPFESQELIDKVDLLLRGGEVPADTPAEETEAKTEEGWDFSDVLEEVDEEVGKPAAAVALLPDEGPAGLGEEVRSLGEFDVSLEEIAEETEVVEPPMYGIAPESGEAGIPEEAVEEIPEPWTEAATEILEEELPPIDLKAEELGFAEPADGEEEIVLQEGSGETAATPPVEEPSDREIETMAEFAPVVEEPVVRLPEDIFKPFPFVPADPFVAEVTAAPQMGVLPEDRPAEDGQMPAVEAESAEARFREVFSDRARAILEKVAEETVEKVMWEMMERLSGEIRQQILEAVESVAWDVIPATAESLIREEIERIRGQAGE